MTESQHHDAPAVASTPLARTILQVLARRTTPIGPERLDLLLTSAGVDPVLFTGGPLIPTLRELEAAGLVARDGTGPDPYHVGYVITDAARGKLQALAATASSGVLAASAHLTPFHDAILSVLRRRGAPMHFSYIDRDLHQYLEFEIDQIVTGLMPALRKLERDGLVVSGDKGSSAISDAGRRYVETKAATLTAPHTLPPDFVDDVLRLIERTGGPNAGHPADQVYGYAVAQALTYAPELIGRQEGWHVFVVDTQFRRAIQRLQQAGFIAEFTNGPGTAPRYAITDAGRTHLGVAHSPPRECRGLDARTNPLYHPDVWSSPDR